MNEKSILKKIAETSKIIRKKHQTLKEQKMDAELTLNEIYKPITDPLKQLVNASPSTTTTTTTTPLVEESQNVTNENILNEIAEREIDPNEGRQMEYDDESMYTFQSPVTLTVGTSDDVPSESIISDIPLPAPAIKPIRKQKSVKQQQRFSPFSGRVKMSVAPYKSLTVDESKVPSISPVVKPSYLKKQRRERFSPMNKIKNKENQTIAPVTAIEELCKLVDVDNVSSSKNVPYAPTIDVDPRFSKYSLVGKKRPRNRVEGKEEQNVGDEPWNAKRLKLSSHSVPTTEKKKWNRKRKFSKVSESSVSPREQQRLGPSKEKRVRKNLITVNHEEISRLLLTNQAGPLFNRYVEGIPDNNTDTSYGIYFKDFKWMLGNCTFQVDENDNILLDGVTTYPSTPGLFELIFKKNPQSELYTSDDLLKYKEILSKTQAHKKNFSASERMLGNRGYKYKHIIAPLFAKQEIQGEGLERAMVVVNDAPIEYVYWNDPNELVDRLQLLTASQAAGHTGHNNEVESILEELWEEGLIL